MKKIIFMVLFILSFGYGQSQIRQVQIKPFIDTTSVEFRNIYQLWENYMDTLFIYSIKSHFEIKKTNKSINSFWFQSEVDNFDFPDLVYSVPGSAKAFYPMEKEYFLGFDARDTNLFELRTMFVNQVDSLFHNTPDIIISQPVIKTGNVYKLYTKFSLLLKEKKLIKKKMNNITYYYSPSYTFNDKKADLLVNRIQEFKKGFQLKNNIQINYLVADNITEIYRWLGIDYISAFDFNCLLSAIEGRAIPVNNMILSGGGGENYMHEIVHIYLNGLRSGRYSLFEEGVACFFGDHQGKSYPYHAKRLKQYLEENKWIDLSKNLQGYYSYKDHDHTYNKDASGSAVYLVGYGDDTTNFSYIIHAVICDMAFRKGGYDLVKKILMEKADNVEEFYPVIEKYLGIKRKNIDKEIKEYVEDNY